MFYVLCFTLELPLDQETVSRQGGERRQKTPGWEVSRVVEIPTNIGLKTQRRVIN